ncbi:hypothetical protein F4803DRAFT_575269 [Xylaria telfairii]|nr:hypothetical protein F4803DRAFT_575269 [Xylaria telfairii]
MSPYTGTTTLVVGIDFGTTYSGVSWLICKTGFPLGQPEIVSLWQTSIDNRQKNPESKKVPSKMHYDRNGKISWGFKIPASAETIEWFKLLLLNKADLQKYLRDSSHLHNAEKALLKLGKTPVQLVGDYLKVLWDYVLEQIGNAQGQTIIDGMPFRVILTVPAIWTDYARDRMREAAKIAGILKHRVVGETTLSFVSEPEAAAIATMPELEGRADLQVDDSFVVVDAGGGTVDIISYKINKLQPLMVSECVEGEAALCGGTFLDKEFEAILKNAVGNVAWNKMNRSDIRRMMNNEWEHGIKIAFNGEPDYYMVELPNRAQRGPLQFTSEALEPIFDKIVSQVGALAEKQIRAVKAKTSKLPKLVILVGGFGRSPYILKYMKGKLDSRIVVLQSQGDKPWTAICRGAVLFGARSTSVSGNQLPQVQSRIARLNYGWGYHCSFQEGVHDQEDKYWDHTIRQWRAKDQVEWVIKRGEDISLKEPKTYDYFIFWDVNERGRGIGGGDFFACADLNPPSRVQGSVHTIARFTYQSPMPREQYRMVTANGTCYREWNFKFKVTVSGASFEVTAISDGQEQKLERVHIYSN